MASGVELLAAVPDPTGLAAGELARSQKTRRRILDAGIACLVEEGYKELSTVLVARRAGITRAAMLYHFPSRRDLLVAIVHHVTRRRIENFEAAMRDLPKDRSFRTRVVDAVAMELASPEFRAYAELAAAARSDRQLAEALRPAMAAYDDARAELGRRLFPPGTTEAPDFQLVRDIVRFLSEGLALQEVALLGMRRPRQRLTALRHFLHLLVSTPDGFRLLERAAAEAPAQPPFRRPRWPARS